RLVQNLLEMARIEAGALKLSRRWDSVSEIINNVLLRSAAALRGHRVRVETEEQQLAVKVDSRLIAEALANLVENAAKYSPRGSEITISGSLHDGELIISVKDQGMGVAPEETDYVFDKFYRGTHAAGKPNRGTGMGLEVP